MKLLELDGMLKKLVSAILVLLFFSFPSLAEIKIFFSPKGGIREEIIKQIDQADNYVDIAMYSFTSESLAEALVRAKSREVRVRILLDKLQAAGRYSQFQYLLDNGIKVITDVHGGIMHNKIAIIDRRVLFTGSFNWTKSAEEKNEENLLLFIDEEEIIRIYQMRLNYLWDFNDSFWEDSD